VRKTIYAHETDSEKRNENIREAIGAVVG